MTGNAFEYCRDAYDANFYMDQVGKSPKTLIKRIRETLLL